MAVCIFDNELGLNPGANDMRDASLSLVPIIFINDAASSSLQIFVGSTSQSAESSSATYFGEGHNQFIALSYDTLSQPSTQSRAMASAHEHFDRDEKVLAGGDVESGSDGKGQSHHVDDTKDSTLAPAVSLRPTRTFEAPEFIRNMTPEERHTVEANLKRKIDFRLMPMIILMYILNYLDRVSDR